MNRRILSNEVDENDEPTQRRLRNRERLWMNLWLYEQR